MEIKGIKFFEELQKIYSFIKSDPNLKSKKLEINYTDADFYTMKIIDEIDLEQKPIFAPIKTKMNVIYGDTDSIMIKMEYSRKDSKKNRIDSFKYGHECASLLTNEVFNRKPIEMECENIYNPFILLKPKGYATKKYEDPKNPFKSKGIVIKGLATIRRNYCQMIRKCLGKVINIIIEENDIQKSINEYYTTLEQINKYTIEINDLISTGLIKKNYKNENIPHITLFKKMKIRKEDINVGDRIPYMFIENNGENKMEKYELSEDPKYAKENNLKFNRGIYTEQLGKVVLGFFKPIISETIIKEMLEKTNGYLKLYEYILLKEKDFIVEKN